MLAWTYLLILPILPEDIKRLTKAMKNDIEDITKQDQRVKAGSAYTFQETDD